MMAEVKDRRNELLARMVLRCRDRRALTQTEFSEISGIGRATVSKIEQGRLFPAKSTRRKLADTLGITPEQLWEEVNELHTPGANTTT